MKSRRDMVNSLAKKVVWSVSHHVPGSMTVKLFFTILILSTHKPLSKDCFWKFCSLLHDHSQRNSIKSKQIDQHDVKLSFESLMEKARRNEIKKQESRKSKFLHETFYLFYPRN